MKFEQGHALLIGVGSYKNHPKLNVPKSVKDAAAIQKVLLDDKLCGYPETQVKLLKQASANKQSILEALEALSETAPKHTVTIFYCGHGYYGTDGSYYLTTHDTQMSNKKVVQGTGISEAELLESLKKIKAERLLLMVNACHAGEIAPTLGEEPKESKSVSLPERTAQALLSAGKGRIILTACRAEQGASIGFGRLTPFGQALVDGLSGIGTASNHGYISVYSLYEHVYEAVKKEVSGLQEPELTVLKGVGPFPVALYPGVKERGKFDQEEPVPSNAVVQVIDQRQSQFYYNQIIQIFKARNQYVAMGDLTIHQHYYGGGTDPDTKQEEDYEQLLTDYLKRAIVDYRTLKFRGLGSRERGIEAPGLERAFVTIRMAAETESMNQAEKGGRRGKLEEDDNANQHKAAELVELADAARLSKKLAIIGGAGSGKSTLLQWAGLATAKQHLKSETLSEEQATFTKALGERLLVPLLLPLRDFSRYCLEQKEHYTTAGMLRFIHYYLNEKYPRLKLPEDFFPRLLAEKGCLVMFDGVDEVDPDERAKVRESMEGLVNDFQNNPHNRYLVTSRTVAYFGEAQVAGFRRCDVQRLSLEQRNRLIHNWCEAVDGEEEGCKKADDLIGRIEISDERVKALAVTPLMVTIFALVFYDQKDLPKQRAELYEHAVRILLTEPYKDTETAEELRKDWEGRRDKLSFIAYKMHICQAENLLEEDLVDLAWLNFGTKEEEKAARKQARDFIRKVADRGGLLEEENRRYGFYTHRTFREFLAGRYLAEELEPDEQKDLLCNVLGKDTWREVVRLATGFLAIDGGNRSDRFIRLVSELGDGAAQRAQALTWAGLCLADLPPREQQPVVWVERRKLVTGEMLEALTANPPKIETRLRYELGLALAEAGDLRFKTSPPKETKGVKAILPEMVRVEAGEFRMGTSQQDKQLLKKQKAEIYDDEEPAHTVRLFEYWIGKYPVTNAEFRCFYDDKGYKREELWGAEGWRWLNSQKRIKPAFWDEAKWNAANLPVVGVTWFEAEAYCKWLRVLTGENYRLPSEAQWEKAARGTDGRLWSWGNTWEAERCNNGEGEHSISSTSPIGMYPHGESPCAALDMLGNVWEWCADWFDETEYQRRKSKIINDPIGPESGRRRVVRGGAWYDLRNLARCAYRSGSEPGSFYGSLGFRILRSPI